MQAKAAGRGLNPVHPFMGENPLVSKDLAVAICTKVVWASIGEVVVAAREGMSFIRKVAGKVAKADKGLLWTTPTGFIVEQAIYNTQSRRVYTYLMGKTSFTIREEMDSIDVAGMRSSSAPNFIHSMDASHLIKSVNSFADSGMKGIAVIHDSFGTHAGKTGDLRRILREEMVQMYQHNWLETFKQSAEDILGEEIKEEAPYVGTLDLNEILESTYAFA
jgi:DNA-directed RNA polymerase